MQLTAVILTKNSEKTLQRCIRSVLHVADEVIVVDSGSTDLSLEIAQNSGCSIVSTPWLGYGGTKNLGHAAARAPYILSIDSDEELSPLLIKDILKVKPGLQGCYAFRRLNNFCGRWIRHGSWNPDIKVRIFPKETLWDNRASHEQLLLKKSTKCTLLQGDLLHYAYESEGQLRQKTRHYAQLGASGKPGMAQPKRVAKMVLSPIMAFVKSFVLKLGFLDGKDGFTISRYIAWGSYLKYRRQ